jgi:hypothetical protein
MLVSRPFFLTILGAESALLGFKKQAFGMRGHNRVQHWDQSDSNMPGQSGNNMAKGWTRHDRDGWSRAGDDSWMSAPEMWTGSASASAAAADTGHGKYSKNVN